jgi:hypothetical protein
MSHRRDLPPITTTEGACYTVADVHRVGLGAPLHVHRGIAVAYDAAIAWAACVLAPGYDYDTLILDQDAPAGEVRRQRSRPAIDAFIGQARALLAAGQGYVDGHSPAAYHDALWARYRSPPGLPPPYDGLLRAEDSEREWPWDDATFFVLVVHRGKVVAAVRDRPRAGYGMP